MSLIQSKNITKYSEKRFSRVSDVVTVEEPLEIRLGFGEQGSREQKSLSVTMRTPGNDEELALGFLFTEGIIQSFTDVLSIKPCCEVGKTEVGNVIRAELNPSVQINWQSIQRHFYTSSSCGVCGKSSIEAVKNSCVYPIQSEFKVSAKTILSLPAQLNAEQLVFKLTGGIHAAALFSSNGKLQLVKEDVGRHNALDKIIGTCLLKNKLPLSNSLLLLSGRISFELVQKAAVAGISIIVAIGAPSSLAIKTAEETNITIIGFLKADKFNIYTNKQRIVI